MKYLKILGLLTVAAAAQMAFVSPASATTLTSPAGTFVPTGTAIHLQSIGHTVLDSAAYGHLECEVTTLADITNPGGIVNQKTASVEAIVTSIAFAPCTSAVMKVLKNGTLKLTSAGSGNGTLVSTGTEVTFETFGVHCIFATNGTTIGTVTGGNPAKLDISATIPRTGGGGGVFCGSSAPWTGTYEVTKPKPLFID